VVTAIMKEQATERLRVVANDALDVHGGKGVQEGPHNYLGSLYRSVPIGITVEGANIVTRSLIQFGQGAIRSHPYLLKEVAALEESDRARWDEEGRQQADVPVLAWCMEAGFATIEARFDAIFANLPNRPAAWWLRFMLLPFGLRWRGPSDRLTQACADILLAPSATRERLTVDIFHGIGDDGLARLERAFARVTETQPIRDRMHHAHVRDIDDARRQGLINEGEASELRATEQAVAAAIAVDDFAPEELAPRQAEDAVPLQWNERKRQARAAPSPLVGEGWGGR
jgi:acyl-CoA dehydrogenase